MKNMSDKEMDKLFQQAAEGYNVPFDESAWEAMDGKLNSSGSSDFGFYAPVVVAILLLVSAATFTVWKTLKSDTTHSDEIGLVNDNLTAEELKIDIKGATKQAEGFETSDVQEDKALQLQSDESENISGNRHQDISIDPSGSIESENTEKLVSKISSNDAQSPGEALKPIKAQNKNDIVGKEAQTTQHKLKTSLSETEINSNARDNNAEISKSGDDRVLSIERGTEEYVALEFVDKNQETGHSDKHQNIDRLRKETKSIHEQLEDDYNHTPLNPNDHPYTISPLGYMPFNIYPDDYELIAVSLGEEDALDKENADDNYSSKLAFKFMIAPDLSSVGYFKPDKPGTHFGFLVEYFLNDRLSLNSGVIKSRKIYFADETSAKGYGGTDIDKIDAECTVADIPININYYFGQKRNFYISGGLSSYIMLTEDYLFKQNIDGRKTEWTENYKNKNNHFFGLLNLSAAYERRLSNSLSFQVEPFLKVPITGIGEGRVNLVSSGMSLNLKYIIF